MVKGKGHIEMLEVARIRPLGLGMKDTARFLGIAYRTLTNRRENGFPVKPRIIKGKPYWDLDELVEYYYSHPKEK